MARSTLVNIWSTWGQPAVRCVSQLDHREVLVAGCVCERRKRSSEHSIGTRHLRVSRGVPASALSGFSIARAVGIHMRHLWHIRRSLTSVNASQFPFNSFGPTNPISLHSHGIRIGAVHVPLAACQRLPQSDASTFSRNRTMTASSSPIPVVHMKHHKSAVPNLPAGLWDDYFFAPFTCGSSFPRIQSQSVSPLLLASFVRAENSGSVTRA